MSGTGHRSARAARACGAVAILVASAALGGCGPSIELTQVQIAVTEFESGRGSRVLLWPADDEGLDWRWIVDVPGYRFRTEVRTLHLPPADRAVPIFDESVSSISALVPRSGGRRLRHRASHLLERLDATHPAASLSLIVTDCELAGVGSVSELLDHRGREVPWKGRYPVYEEEHAPRRDRDFDDPRNGEGIFIR